jgi:hypothetical protein
MVSDPRKENKSSSDSGNRQLWCNTMSKDKENRRQVKHTVTHILRYKWYRRRSEMSSSPCPPPCFPIQLCWVILRVSPLQLCSRHQSMASSPWQDVANFNQQVKSHPRQGKGMCTWILKTAETPTIYTKHPSIYPWTFESEQTTRCLSICLLDNNVLLHC